MEEYTNETEEFNEEEAGFTPEVDTFPIILALLIIIANSLGIALFARNRRLRNITNTFLVSLAISDLLTGLFGIPFYLICSVTQHKFCITATLFWRFTTTSTVLHLLAVTLDRYAAIVHAIRYHSIITSTVAKITILIIWFTACFVSLVQLSWHPHFTAPLEMSEEEFEAFENKTNLRNAIYDVCTLAIFFVLPLLVMVYSYVRIIIIVRYHENQMKRHNMPSTRCAGESRRKNSSFNIQAQWKSAIVFLTMILVYVVCWLPFFLHRLREMLELFSLPHWAEYVFIYYPRFVTSLTNPLFYIIGKHDFRKALFPKKEHQNGTQMTSLIGRTDSRS